MKKLLIVGLGNPGDRFEGTRHNVGREMIVDWFDSIGEDEQGKVKCFLPEVLMNNSGVAVAEVMRKNGVGVVDVLLVHDDLELPLGEVKIVEGGSAKGHNGVRSVYQHVGSEEIPRLRMGIGRPDDGVEVSDFVLSRFNSAELDVVEKMKKKAALELSSYVQERD